MTSYRLTVTFKNGGVINFPPFTQWQLVTDAAQMLAENLNNALLVDVCILPSGEFVTIEKGDPYIQTVEKIEQLGRGK
jgi:hypothetical protein